MLIKELYNIEIQKAVYSTLNTLDYSVTDNFNKDKDKSRIFINDINIVDTGTKTEQMMEVYIYITNYSVSTSSMELKVMSKGVYNAFLNGLFSDYLKEENLLLQNIAKTDVKTQVFGQDTTGNNLYQNILTFSTSIGVLDTTGGN